MRTSFINVTFNLSEAQKDVSAVIRYIDKIASSVRGHMTQINPSHIKTIFTNAVTEKIKTWGSRGTKIQGRVKALIKLFHVEVVGDSLNKNVEITHPWKSKGGEDKMFHPNKDNGRKYNKPIGKIIYSAIQSGRSAFTIPAYAKRDRTGMTGSKKLFKFQWHNRGSKNVLIKWKDTKKGFLQVESEEGVDFESAGRQAILNHLSNVMNKVREKVRSVRK